MAHQEQMNFFEKVFKSGTSHFESGQSVIDFGSLEINEFKGPHIFVDRNKLHYLGVDLDKGPNVDIVERGELVSFQSGTFDIAMSSELFEHAPSWKEIFVNMCRLTKPGGLVIWSCGGRMRREHGTTRSDGGYAAPFVVDQGVEYYKNVSAHAASKALAFSEWFDLYEVYENFKSFDTYFIGLRKGANSTDYKIIQKLISEFDVTYRNIPYLSFIKAVIQTRTFEGLYRLFVKIEKTKGGKSLIKLLKLKKYD